MNKGRRNKWLVYSMCLGMVFMNVPIRAQEIPSQLTQATKTSTITPKTWDELKFPEEISTNVIVNLTKFKASTNRATEIPAEVNKVIEISPEMTDVTVQGSLDKLYQGLSIKVLPRETDLKLTIKDLTIEGTETGIDITGNTKDTYLTIEGTNSIKSTRGNGIAVYTGNSLIIDAKDYSAALTIKAGSGATGIGGRYKETGGEKYGSGEIKIVGGTLHVTGGDHSAAIGSGSSKGGTTPSGDITITGGHITAIGGGQQGNSQGCTVTISQGSSVYAEAEDHGGKETNSLGAGHDVHHTMSVAIQGNVFMGNNQVGAIDKEKSASNIKNYIFECYKIIGTTTDDKGNIVNIREKMIAANVAIKNNKDKYVNLQLTTDGTGRIYGWLEDFGTAKLSSLGYYFTVKEDGKVSIATEFDRKEEESSMIIMVEFREMNTNKPTINLGEAGESLIIPYALSNIDFVSEIKEDTSVSKDSPDTFNFVKAEIDLNQLPGDIAPFDLDNTDKIYFVVMKRNGNNVDGTPKYEYDSGLTEKLNATNNIKDPGRVGAILDKTNNKIIINYPAELMNYNEYMIRILIPNILTDDINKYVSNHVEATDVAHQVKKVSVKMTYSITSHLKIEELVFDDTREFSVDEGLDLRYWYLTKVN